MGWDFAKEAVRVLSEGLPEAPRSPTPGHTFPAALHRGDRFGAVLFLRLWRNGQWDSDTAITRRGGHGWAEPSACGGGPWVNPYEHGRELGGDVEVFSTIGSREVTPDGEPEDVVVVEGMVRPGVAGVLCRTSRGTFRYDIDSAVGAFVIVVEGNEEPSLVPVDHSGEPLSPDTKT